MYPYFTRAFLDMHNLANKDLSPLSFPYLYNMQAFNHHYNVKQAYVTLRKIFSPNMESWQV